eukprot:1031863-Rhodomonas_salina.1
MKLLRALTFDSVPLVQIYPSSVRHWYKCTHVRGTTSRAPHTIVSTTRVPLVQMYPRFSTESVQVSTGHGLEKGLGGRIKDLVMSQSQNTPPSTIR